MIPFPERKYDIILADPPWSYYGSPVKDQAAGKHYSLMTDDELRLLPVHEVAEKNCILFLWATCPRLDSAIKLMTSWGFCFRGVAFVWVKTTHAGKVISGQGVRPSLVKPTTEFVLWGSNKHLKGRPMKLLDESIGQVVLAPRPGGIHSRKPVEVHERIEALLGDKSRLEMFARTRRDGWEAWGNEAPVHD